MAKLYNGTPHAINVVVGAVFNSSIRKYVGGVVAVSIPSNGMLSAKMETESIEPIIVGDVSIPQFTKKVVGIDPLPEGYDVYIVSALYAMAARQCGLDMTKIRTVMDPVYSADGNSFVGCLGVGPAI
jgi:hypothetical protein